MNLPKRDAIRHEINQIKRDMNSISPKLPHWKALKEKADNLQFELDNI